MSHVPGLKSIRKSRGLTQEQLAQQVELQTQTISAYETGVRSPTVGVLRRIAAALNCSIGDLFSFPSPQDGAPGAEPMAEAV